jgi:hypothetical protein
MSYGRPVPEGGLSDRGTRASRTREDRPAWDSNRADARKTLTVSMLLAVWLSGLGVRDGIRNYLITAA